MSNPSANHKRIAIIGGGISGLAAAYRVRELNPSAEITLFEAADRLGGSLQTIRQDGFLIEQGADSFITNTLWASDLCRRIGLADQLIPTNSNARGAMVVAHGKLERVPEGFLLMAPQKLGSILRTPILSLSGKARLAGEYFIKAREASAGDDESVASFVRRRLGREAFERLVQPLVGGIYTADPEKLSLAATLPRFLEMERQHGGLIRGVRAQKQNTRDADGANESGARYSMFMTPKHGLSSFVDAIAARLPKESVQLNCKTERIEKAASQWCVVSGNKSENFDGLILATSAAVTAKLLNGVDPSLADELAGIEYAGSAVVTLGYDRKQIGHALDSFGFVVPAIERRRILSASFSSVKFPGRAPNGKELIRVFLGGALQSEMLDLSDDQLCQNAEEELRDLLQITGSPCLSLVFRWPASMPQYHLGHLDRVARINDRVAQLIGLALAGNAYGGVGIPQCVRSGEEAGARVLERIEAHK
jgi:oxygen-dependent protoporphyrinogen oxidase